MSNVSFWKVKESLGPLGKYLTFDELPDRKIWTACDGRVFYQLMDGSALSPSPIKTTRKHEKLSGDEIKKIIADLKKAVRTTQKKDFRVVYLSPACSITFACDDELLKFPCAISIDYDKKHCENYYKAFRHDCRN